MTKKRPGRHTPFFRDIDHNFFRTTDVTGVIDLPEGVEMCMPGDNVGDDNKAYNTYSNRRLKICYKRRRRTVGAGAVASILE